MRSENALSRRAGTHKPPGGSPLVKSPGNALAGVGTRVPESQPGASARPLRSWQGWAPGCRNATGGFRPPAQGVGRGGHQGAGTPPGASARPLTGWQGCGTRVPQSQPGASARPLRGWQGWAPGCRIATGGFRPPAQELAGVGTRVPNRNWGLLSFSETSQGPRSSTVRTSLGRGC
ncbi:MAG: hypothetical protein RLZZ436_1192 [Planctomycetota bacterium]